MNIAVHGIKHFPRMSRETNCYTAVVTLDGRAIAEAENDGGGGMTMIRSGLPFTGNEATDKARRDAWRTAEAAMTDHVAKTFGLRLEDHIDLLVYAVIAKKEAERELKKMRKFFNTKTGYRTPAMKEGVYGTFNHACDDGMIAHIEKTYPGAVVLNLLDDAALLKAVGL